SLANQAAEHADQIPACQALQIDVTDIDAPAMIFDAAEKLGNVTALVNNAGITGGQGPLAELSDATLERVLAVNLDAPIRLGREAARRWQNRDYPSHIVNITSVAARTGSPNEYVTYAAAKGGMETLTVGLARELAPHHIYVNAVSPGTMDPTTPAPPRHPDTASRLARRRGPPPP